MRRLLSQRRPPLRAAAALVALGALAVAGCNKDSGDLNRGQQLFSSRCGTCHTLAAAGTMARRAPTSTPPSPPLERGAWTPTRSPGSSRRRWRDPRPPSQNPSVTMPPELASGQDLNDIAAYVGSVAGTGVTPPHLSPSQLFVSSCGGCHTLAAAGTSGTTGPDLDQNLAGKTKAFINQSIVDPSKVIAKGYSDGIMPQNFATAIKPADLAALVDYLYTSTNKGK